MRAFLTVTILVSLLALGLLMPQWNRVSILAYTGMSIAGLGIIAAIWARAWTNPILRVLAALLAAAMILNGISFVRTQRNTGGSLSGARTPLVGVLVVGLPALLFAITGRPRVESLFGPVKAKKERD